MQGFQIGSWTMEKFEMTTYLSIHIAIQICELDFFPRNYNT